MLHELSINSGLDLKFKGHTYLYKFIIKSKFELIYINCNIAYKDAD